MHSWIKLPKFQREVDFFGRGLIDIFETIEIQIFEFYEKSVVIWISSMESSSIILT